MKSIVIEIAPVWPYPSNVWFEGSLVNTSLVLNRKCLAGVTHFDQSNWTCVLVQFECFNPKSQLKHIISNGSIFWLCDLCCKQHTNLTRTCSKHNYTIMITSHISVQVLYCIHLSFHIGMAGMMWIWTRFEIWYNTAYWPPAPGGLYGLLTCSLPRFLFRARPPPSLTLIVVRNYLHNLMIQQCWHRIMYSILCQAFVVQRRMSNMFTF